MWRQHPLLSSKKKFLPLLWSALPNWNEPPAFPWHCFSSAQTWEKRFSRMEATSLADQITHGLQATSDAVPWAHYSQFWGGYYVLTTEPGPWLQPASQATSGAGEDLWSHFLSTLASFFTSLKISYFHHHQFLFSPAVVVSPQTELWSTGVAATWTVPAAETDWTSPKLKGFFIQNKTAGRRNSKGQEAIPRTHSGYTGVHLIIILILHNSYMFFHVKNIL